MNANLEVNDKLNVQVIFDPTVGDILKTTGNGDIKITFDKDGDGTIETYKVESVRLESEILNNASIVKVIIGEGIESIESLISTSASAVEEIVLPSSLKVIQNCFNNLNKLNGITIPNGVEVIIGSFWANTYASHNGYGQYNKGEQYSFDIAIPDSVKNLSMVPGNLTFSHTKENAKAGNFYKDGNRIYKLDDRAGHSGDLILVSDVTNDTVVVVPEGVKGIQVGTLLGLDSDTFYIYHVAAVMVDNLRRLLLGINLSDKAIMDFDFPGVGFPV